MLINKRSHWHTEHFQLWGGHHVNVSAAQLSDQWMLLSLTPWVFSWFVVSIRREFTSMCWSAPGFSKRPLHARWMSRLHNSTSHRSRVSSGITSLNCTSTSSRISHACCPSSARLIDAQALMLAVGDVSILGSIHVKYQYLHEFDKISFRCPVFKSRLLLLAKIVSCFLFFPRKPDSDVCH